MLINRGIVINHIVIDNTIPTIELTSPMDDGIETGEVSIDGVVTDGNFGSYRVEIVQGANPDTGWEQLGGISESQTIERKWQTDGLADFTQSESQQWTKPVLLISPVLCGQ